MDIDTVARAAYDYAINAGICRIKAEKRAMDAWIAYEKKQDNTEVLTAIKNLPGGDYMDPGDISHDTFEADEDNTVMSTQVSLKNPADSLAAGVSISAALATRCVESLAARSMLSDGCEAQLLRDLTSWKLDPVCIGDSNEENYAIRPMALAIKTNLAAEAAIFSTQQAAEIAGCSEVDLLIEMQKLDDACPGLDAALSSRANPQQAAAVLVADNHLCPREAIEAAEFLENNHMLATGRERAALKKIIAWEVSPGASFVIKTMAMAMHSGMAARFGEIKSVADGARLIGCSRSLLNKIKLELANSLGDLNFIFRRPKEARILYSNVQKEKHWRKKSASAAFEKHEKFSEVLQ